MNSIIPDGAASVGFRSEEARGILSEVGELEMDDRSMPFMCLRHAKVKKWKESFWCYLDRVRKRRPLISFSREKSR